jgi:hypothetical protein
VAGGLLLAAAYEADRTESAQLARAAQVVTDVAPTSTETVAVAAAGRTVRVPTAMRLDRGRGILLALESERLRRQAVGALEALAAGGSEEDAGQRAADLLVAYGLARQRLEGYLKIDGPRARLVLYALGWPWASSAGPGRSLAEFTATDSLWPPPLASVPEALREGLAEIVVEAPAWATARAELKSRFPLSEEQLVALRAHLCRRAVSRALVAESAMERARKDLAKYVDLVPAQTEAVLAMSAALRLVRAGRAAHPALEAMSEEHPELAAILLRQIRAAGPQPPAREPSHEDRE